MKPKRKIKYKKSKKVNLNLIKLFPIALAAVLISIIFTNINRKKSLDIPLENVTALKITYENMIKLKEISAKYDIDFSEFLTYYCIENNYFENKVDVDNQIEQNFIMNYDNIKKKYNKKSVENYYKLFDNVYKEIKCFPISTAEGETIKYIYGDSWGNKRTYGGNRTHMGTDIMDRENIRGRIPIISMTDGVVENIGWGYKIITATL